MSAGSARLSSYGPLQTPQNVGECDGEILLGAEHVPAGIGTHAVLCQHVPICRPPRTVSNKAVDPILRQRDLSQAPPLPACSTVPIMAHCWTSGANLMFDITSPACTLGKF